MKSSKLTGYDPEADAARGGIEQRVVQNVWIVSVASDKPLDPFWGDWLNPLLPKQWTAVGNGLLSPFSRGQIRSTCRDMASSTSRSNRSLLTLISFLDSRFLFEHREQLSYGMIRSVGSSVRMRNGDQCTSCLKHFAWQRYIAAFECSPLS